MVSRRVVGALILALVLSRRRRRRNRVVWTREWIRNRPRQGVYQHLMTELRISDPSSFRSFLRMDATTFELLLAKVAPFITYQNTKKREAISPAERLALTLRFLATGETFSSIQFLYWIPAQTIGQIVSETCAVITSVLQKDYLKVPTTEDEWKKIAREFNERWNFPHCTGAIDGKHVLIKPPPNSGSYYFNYKHSFSIVLLGVADADYRFIYVDVGCNGRVADGGVLQNSSLSEALENNTLNIPQAEVFPGVQEPIPFLMVADDAFPLKVHIQKPYAQTGLTRQKRVFNYRLSRARRIIENAFGILANRFRVFMNPIPLLPERVEEIVMACCCLHNFLRAQPLARDIYSPQGSMDYERLDTHELVQGEWRNQESSQGIMPANRLQQNRGLQ